MSKMNVEAKRGYQKWMLMPKQIAKMDFEAKSGYKKGMIKPKFNIKMNPREDTVNEC